MILEKIEEKYADQTPHFQFKAVFRSFPDIFRSWDNDSLALLAVTRPRIVRQTLFLTSNYYHNVMLVHSSGSTSDQDPSSPDQNQTYPNGQNSTTNGKFTSHNVEPSPRGALEAAHDAINAFFLLFKLFEGEAKVWWVFNHRAFLEAMCIGNILREQNAIDSEIVEKDLLYVRGKGDIGMFICFPTSESSIFLPLNRCFLFLKSPTLFALPIFSSGFRADPTHILGTN